MFLTPTTPLGARLSVFITLLLGLGLSGVVAWKAEQFAQRAERQHLNRLIEKLRHDIAGPFSHFTYGLRGTRSLWPASKSVERGEFSAMIADRDLFNEFPGALGVGYIQRVAKADLARFLERTRADEAPGFSLKNPSDAPELNIVEYIEPHAANASVEGLDLGQEPASQAAAERAMLTGAMAMTSQLTLSEGTAPSQGFRLFLPVYQKKVALGSADERRAALIGWTYMPVVTERVFKPLVGRHAELDFTITEAIEHEPVRTVFAASSSRSVGATPTRHATPRHQGSVPIEVGGCKWTLTYASSDQFLAVTRTEVYVAAIGGPLITLLIAGILLGFGRTHNKAKSLALAMTSELTAAVVKAERLALVATHTTNAIVFTDAQRLTTWVNAGFTRITGYSPSEAIGISPGKLLQSELTDPATVLAMRTAMEAGLGFNGEILNRSKTGQDYWLSLDIVPLHNEAGELTGFMAIELDISERKAAELRLAEQARATEAALVELRRTETELQQKTQRLTLATRAGHIGIFDWNIVTNELQSDDTLVALYGLPPDSRMDAYECWARAVHPDDLPRCEEELRHALDGTRPFDTEFRIYWPDGSLHYIRSHGIVVRDDAGQPLQMIGINWDITATKLDQERLLVFSRAVMQSPASVVITNTRGEIEYVNEAFSRITGYTSAEILGKNPRILKSGETTPECYFELWTKIRSGEAWSGVFHNMTKSGRLFWQSSTITPIRSDSGAITHYLASNEDITERRSLEASIAHERWLLNCLMETVPALIYFKDVEGRFIQVNQSLASFLGTTPSAIIGLNDADFYPVAEATRTAAAEHHIIETGRPLLDEIECMTHPNGTQHWFSTCKLPLRNDAGRITGTFGLSTDITAQKRSDEDRANLHIQLTQAQKLESIGMLASGIAHEINTPAQFVTDNLAYVTKSVASLDPVLAAHPRLLAALAAAGPLDPAVAEWVTALPKVKIEHLRRELPAALDDARDGMGRITQIVRAMKSFSHPSSEKAALADLNQAIENTLVVCRNEWKYVATVETHFDPALPPVPCHLGDFNQVVVNLVVNAAHAIGDVVAKAPGTQGVITVTTRLVEGWAEVRIGDTGTGIPESARAHLFTPFFTTKEVGKGTGQGLALARSVIADRHKGSLHFETELGQGTTFIIRLPLVAPEPKPALRAAAPGNGAEAGSTSELTA